MENKEIYQRLAITTDAYKRCVKNNNTEWEVTHEETIKRLLNELPHGSGIDWDWTIDHWKCSSKKLFLSNSYHVRNENGYYDGWIDFTVKVEPDLIFGINLTITGNFGKNQDIKDYLYDILG